MSYTGDVSVEDAWEALAEKKTAVLVDVRTRAEWAYVGICDLSALGKSPLLASWQEFPHMAVNPDFVRMIDQMTGEQNIPKDSSLYFLCRSGVRSRSAAAAMINAGYSRCFNVLAGFEGDLDQTGRRGNNNGWKAAGLPWRQS